MPGPIKDSVKEEIRILFEAKHSIRDITRILGLSRNSVRKHIRSEGLTLAMYPADQADTRPLAVPPRNPTLEALDFLMLEKMFAQIGEPASGRDYEKHIKGLAVDIGRELGVSGRIDVLRLEVAVANYISWRRFYFRSLEAGEKTYCGPFAKSVRFRVTEPANFTNRSHRSVSDVLPN